MFDELIENAVNARTDKMEEGDFIGADGRVYCGKCGTPRQTSAEIILRGKAIHPWIDCKCREEKKRKEENERKEMHRQAVISFRRDMCFCGSKYRMCRFEDDDRANEELSTLARNYVEKFSEFRKDGKGLLLYGGYGTGKTFMAACIANALIDKGHTCLMTDMSKIKQKSFNDKDYLNRLDDYEILIIDDFGIESDSSYSMEIIHNVINRRLETGQPLIMTTNLGKADFEDVRLERIVDRLLQMCIRYEVKGTSRRKKEAKATDDMYKEMLGIK